MKRCLNPTIGNMLLSYELGHLSREDTERFEQHLFECDYCAEEIIDDEWFVTVLTAAIQQSRLAEILKSPLPITAIYTRNHSVDLTDAYYGNLNQEQWAASTTTTGTLAFPITIEYAEGKAIGQFWKRYEQLSFRLTHSTIEQTTYAGILIYTPTSTLTEEHIFGIQAGEEKVLGKFDEFIKSETPHGFVEALQRFRFLLQL